MFFPFQHDLEVYNLVSKYLQVFNLHLIIDPWIISVMVKGYILYNFNSFKFGSLF